MDPVQFGASCRQVRATLSEHGISSRTLWEPLHRSEVFRGCQSLNGVVAERLFDECLSLPSTATLEDNELDRICHIVSRCHGVSKAA